MVQWTQTHKLSCRCVTGSSAKRHGGSNGGSELCNILNHVIREDDPNATVHAVVFANALNAKLVGNRTTDAWIQKLFPKSDLYVLSQNVRPVRQSFQTVTQFWRVIQYE